MFDVHFQASMALGDGARRNRLLLPYSPPIRFLGSSFLGKIPLSELDPETIIPLARPGTEMASGFPLVTYFQAIQQVIEKKDYEHLLAALQIRLNRQITLDEIREISIFSEKHGSDYHPARVEVDLGDRSVLFVMNVALTERGRFILANEFKVLGQLGLKATRPYLPKAYFLEEAAATIRPEGGSPILMVLADWLEGYFEFHLSPDPADGRQKLVLWDSARHDHYLADRDAGPIYKEIASILTSCYDLKTFAQIHPWHLAAGDFIARIGPDRVEVRLVAVCQYGPLIGPEDLPGEEALLFFLLNLTLRIRLDRLDGVGEISWANEGCLPPTLEGFFQALEEKIKKGEFPGEFLILFRRFLKFLTMEDFEERFAALVESGDPSAPDLPVIQKHLDRHSEFVFLLTKRKISDYRKLLYVNG